MIDYTTTIVMVGAILIGCCSGMLGSFAYLRAKSLMGDVVSHATLPGIVAAFLLTGDRALWILLIGATIAGLASMVVVEEVLNRSKIKQDAALGIALAGFFGVGIVLLTYAMTTPLAGKAGLDQFLFGQAAIMSRQDVWTIGIVGAVLLAIMTVFWHPFALISFDPVFARAQRLPIRMMDILLHMLIVLSIVIGLQTVGVILMSAMLAVPAAAARQWTGRLVPMVILSGALGAAAGTFGVFGSSLVPGIPTGPMIVVAITILFGISVLCAPRRGLIARWIRMRQHRQIIDCAYAPRNLYEY
jgi:manganese/zinc/iron transport system permease protein